MDSRFTENDIQKSLSDITRNLKENTDEYLKERRNSFYHLTLLLATVLGFTVGITTIRDGSVNIILKFTWFFQIVAILVGIFILILESETRYHRGFFATSAMLDILKDIKSKGGIFDRTSISSIMIDAFKKLSGNTQDTDKRERFFSWFTRNIKKIEILFYILFALSFIFLLASFFT
jgi:hypothetical protein